MKNDKYMKEDQIFAIEFKAFRLESIHQSSNLLTYYLRQIRCHIKLIISQSKARLNRFYELAL